jgi:hypothetical protein
MFKRAIVGFFRVLRKAATGELSHFQMIGNTLATDPFSGAGLIGTVTFFKVLLPITFHGSILPPICLKQAQPGCSIDTLHKLTMAFFEKIL